MKANNQHDYHALLADIILYQSNLQPYEQKKKAYLKTSSSKNSN